jgi:hypothetical protein
MSNDYPNLSASAQQKLRDIAKTIHQSPAFAAQTPPHIMMIQMGWQMIMPLIMSGDINHKDHVEAENLVYSELKSLRGE